MEHTTTQKHTHSRHSTSKTMEFPSVLHVQCLLGDLDVSNRVMFEYYCLSVAITSSVALMLLFNHNLHKFYSPLANMVDLSILSQFLAATFYFLRHPYLEGEGNCGEQFFNRTNTVAIMFAELHQIFFIANVLGLGNYNHVLGRWKVITLKSFLFVALVFVVGSTTLACVIGNESVALVDSFWNTFVSTFQLRIIWIARSASKDQVVNAVLDASDSAVLLFERLSKLQALLGVANIFLAITCMSFESSASWATVLSCIDIICTLIYYLKVLLITVNANVSIQYVT